MPVFNLNFDVVWVSSNSEKREQKILPRVIFYQLMDCRIVRKSPWTSANKTTLNWSSSRKSFAVIMSRRYTKYLILL